MEKEGPPSIFVNDGSFMERFKQLRQENDGDKEKEKGVTVEDSKPVKIISGIVNPKPSIIKSTIGFKMNKTQNTASGGKLAFSLKQKSKLVAPAVKLSEDEDEADHENDSGNASAKKQKLDHKHSSERSSRQADGVPPSPSDPTVKNVADRLASFVAKHGRQLEHITRQKNPGDTPFKFLFDESCADYKYYVHKLGEEEKALSLTKQSQTPCVGGRIPASKAEGTSERAVQQRSGFQIPASALYETPEVTGASSRSVLASGARVSSSNSSAVKGTDPVAMMEFYMKKAATEEKMRQPKQSKDEMPPPASLQGSSAGKRGHHMGDYIPPEELNKFLAKCDDVAAQKAAKEAAEKAKIQADNVGHKLLSKMGWKEGEGIGGARKGIADPIAAGNIKTNNLGVGASAPGEVNPEDDIYEQYKKRMMLGYKHRPNPLGNPRKSYY